MYVAGKKEGWEEGICQLSEHKTNDHHRPLMRVFMNMNLMTGMTAEGCMMTEVTAELCMTGNL